MTIRKSAQALEKTYHPNLWQQAWDSLDNEVKAGITLRGNSRRVVDSVLHTAKEKQQLCLRKKWRFRKSNGEEIIVRDVLDKIVSWLDKFKAIGDVATQYDPVHTSLPWAGVRFVLQVMAVSDQHVFGATVEGIETISQLITRYTIFETLYLDCNSPIRAELESALVRLYKKVLAYLVKAKRYFQTSTTKRVLKSAFYTAEDNQMKAIEAEEKRVAALTTLADMEELKRTGENVAATQSLVKLLEQPILRMADETTTAMRRLEINKQSALLQWLSSVPFIQHHKDHIRKNIPGCGHWFLNHPEYQNWKSSSSSSILLLHGIPGSGKTSITANVIDSFLQNRSGPNGSVAAPVAYFYCTRNSFEPQRSDPEDIMQSLLRQLAFSQNNQRDIHEAVLNDYQRREDEAKLNGWDIPKLCISECVRLILDITLSYPVTIIIDAMDEVQETRWHELVTALDRIVKESTNVAKILISSRDHFVKNIRSDHRVQIQSSDCYQDMAIFVRHHVTEAIHNRRLLGGDVSDGLREELVQTLLTAAKEM
ncbi:hypothetical protein ASPWEDRAFT_120837 [Aspergillus wentii DTO 134E9]|uniref:NWD NACHT-NTPase N-terminal domain-containing protein n=1 Tax=Aspergillus wentii DTO 134E9 TaxID=1073089 RepID=A0A1L9R599_ASPWE|nr:uncharacterized protein ASPWEDRAFT_120837 [Aspergillus wentii DTO 134E9]OJJ30091.1 hypothetical protein ASPWEDRAFT_120837 [Aspergillus wentii DTO 134E9]